MRNFWRYLAFVHVILSSLKQLKGILSADEQSIRRNSVEKEIPKCLSFLTKPRIQCITLTDYLKEQGLEKPKKDKIGWYNIVIFMIIHNDSDQGDLIKAHLKTWLRRVGKGLDVVFISDVDDPRSLEDIVTKNPPSKANFRLYKSDAKFDGKHIRFKMIDAIRHITKVYKGNSRKKYFFKMDTDSYLLGKNLLDYLNKLHDEVQTLPIQIGNLMCVQAEACHAGGAFYGFNKKGIEAVNSFFIMHPNIYQESKNRVYNGKVQNLMLHEDFMVSYVFKTATQVPPIYQHEIYQNTYEFRGIGTEESPSLTYHLLKSPELIYMHDNFFYGSNGRSSKIRSFQQLQYDYENNEKQLEWVPQVGWVFIKSMEGAN